MRKHRLILFLLLFSACEPKVKTDDFDLNTCRKFHDDLSNKFKTFSKDNQIENPLNFLDLYSNYCHFGLDKKKDYQIIQAYNVVYEHSYTDFKKQKFFYYELAHFKDAAKMDTTVAYIKRTNCIDPFNLKIHKIYRVGTNAIICINYIDSNPKNNPLFFRDFEALLKKDFKTVVTTVINDY